MHARDATHLLEGAIGELLSVVENHDPMGQCGDKAHVMLDDHEREVRPLGADGADVVHQRVGVGVIHAGGRLVEQQHLRFARQGARDLEAAAVRLGQFRGRAVTLLEQVCVKRSSEDAPHGPPLVSIPA